MQRPTPRPDLSPSSMDGATTDAPAPDARVHDLVIIGGGPAGASAALVAGRASLDAVLIDAGTPRNAVVDHTHGLLTRDGVGPAELRRLGRRDLARYPSLGVLDDRVVRVEAMPDGFVVDTASGAVLRTRRLLLATGTRDDLDRAGLPGLSAVYGKSVFPCPFCDGHELRARTLAVFLGDLPPAGAAHYLAMVGMLSNARHTVFTNGRALAPVVAEQVARMGNRAITEPIVALVADGGQLREVRLVDGRVHEAHAGFVAGGFSSPASDVPATLGVGTAEHPFFSGLPACDEDGRTTVPGLYVAGDARVGFGGLVRALAQGAHTAATVVAAIAEERFSGA